MQLGELKNYYIKSEQVVKHNEIFISYVWMISHLKTYDIEVRQVLLTVGRFDLV